VSDTPALSKSYFLSYSRADQDFALRFASDLRGHGVAMWVDQFDIRPSEHWDRAIERAVHECRGLVVIVSPRSVESDNVADEISYAIEHKKPVLPVMIEKCRLPLRITRMQVIDATGSYELALEQSVQVLGGEGPLASRAAEQLAPPKGVSDGEVLATAKARLTDVLGPIASIVVARESRRAGSVAELYRLLGEHISCEKDRERFVAAAGEPIEGSAAPRAASQQAPRSAIAQSDVERLGSLLTPFLGPIAAAVARRESAGAASADDLQQRLAGLIPNERERADFLRRAQAR
jgi:hypothetical protein